jgi:hypothetical protein
MSVRAGSKFTQTLRTGASDKAVKGLGGLIPWRVTGPVSHPEWKDVPISSNEYRTVSPSSVSNNAKIPQASHRLIYNVGYFPRDSRRFKLFSEESVRSISPSSLNGMSSRLYEKNPLPQISFSRLERTSLVDYPDGGYS